MNRGIRSRAIVTSVIMIPLAALVAVPFYYIVVNTFKTQQETATAPLALPTSLFLGNYIEVFESVPILRAFANTLIVTVAAVLLQLLVGALAAYAVIIRRSWVTRLVALLLVIAFLVPFQTTLIPIYQMLVAVNLVDTLAGLVVIYLGGAVFSYFLIIGYMRTIPYELIEAARIDGAGSFRIFWSIVLPLIRPILVTVAVFQTMWIWNDFIVPNVFLSSSENKTLVLQVYNAVSQFAVDWPAFMTLTVIVLLPMLVFFLVTQKHIVSGLVSGSVKG